MTDNNKILHISRMLRTRDLESGEELMVVYFPTVGSVTINGDSVTRSLGLGNWAGQTVFHGALGNKKFTVATDSVAKLYL